MTTRPGVTARTTLRTVPWLMLAPEPLPPNSLPPKPLPPFGLPKLPVPPFPEPELADGGWVPESANATTRPPAVAAIAATAI